MPEKLTLAKAKDRYRGKKELAALIEAAYEVGWWARTGGHGVVMCCECGVSHSLPGSPKAGAAAAAKKHRRLMNQACSAHKIP